MPKKQRPNAVSAEKSFSLKDRLFNAETVGNLVSGLQRADKKFAGKAFSKSVLQRLPELELKACIECMADTLVEYLPQSYDKAVATLLRALPPALDPELQDDDFGHFIWAVPSEFAARQGCSEEHLETSFRLLHAATQRFSAEFAIRPFLQAFPDETYGFLQRCAVDDHYHVRRLASEGIRPYLPWGLRVVLPVDQVLQMLDLLHADQTRFVTRSVANTLNDLSRNHPEDVLRVLARWNEVDAQQAGELEWMTRHALRGLVKADNPEALAMLGYPPKPKFKLADVVCADTVAVGGALNWQGTLISGARQKLKILLRVHFLKANGTHAPKVFALKDIQLTKGETVDLAKRLAFKPMTTRTLYPGEHHIELVVNGAVAAKRRFELAD